MTAKYLSTTKPSTSAPAVVCGGAGPQAQRDQGPPRGAVAFPQIVDLLHRAADPIPDHPSGRALDLMIPNYRSSSGKALGDKVADWARPNAKSSASST